MKIFRNFFVDSWFDRPSGAQVRLSAESGEFVQVLCRGWEVIPYSEYAPRCNFRFLFNSVGKCKRRDVNTRDIQFMQYALRNSLMIYSAFRIIIQKTVALKSVTQSKCNSLESNIEFVYSLWRTKRLLSPGFGNRTENKNCSVNNKTG